MSYTVLARKWRPRLFAEIVGQQHVVKALVNSLSAERLHHAYLFAGTRGVGKTTLARILAKALNCAGGIVAEPCGVCEGCTAIDEGRFVDLIEVDAASRTRVDDTRELLENTQYTPAQGRFKVYLIDEVHMLSNHSFNALLKTLEEPPPHIKFLLATTDPQKLPVTVLSRCLQFNLKRLTVAEIHGQLTKICEAEGVAAESDGLQSLSRSADGSLRDGLSLLDQAIAFGGGEVNAEAVSAMLGSIDRRHVLRFLHGLSTLDGSALMNEVAELDEQAPDYGAVLDELMGLLQRVAVLQLVGSTTEEEVEELSDLARAMSPEDVQLYYQIALQGRRDLSVCRDYRSAFEMTLLRMLAFRPYEEDAPTAGRAPRQTRAQAPSPPAARGAGEARAQMPSLPAARAAGEARAQAPSPPAARGAGEARAQASSPPATRGTGEVQAPSPPAARAAGEVRAQAPSPPAARAAGEARAEKASTGGESAREEGSAVPGPEDWYRMLSESDVRGAPRQLAEHCALKGCSRGVLELVLAPENAHLNTDQVRSRLRDGLRDGLQEPVSLTITVGEPPVATPAQIRAEGESERMRSARASIENDPTVKEVQAVFDAVLDVDSIRPSEEGH